MIAQFNLLALFVLATFAVDPSAVPSPVHDPAVQSAWNATVVTLLEAGITLLAVVVSASIAWITRRVGRWLDETTKSKVFFTTMAKINTTTDALVKELENSMVEALRRANADGKLTVKETEEVLSTAVTRAREHLGERGIAEMMDALGHAGEEGRAMVDRILRTHIEARVTELRSKINPS